MSVKALITAGNHSQYRAYLIANRLKPWEYPYISTVEKLHGYGNTTLYIVGAAWENSEHNKIMEYAQMHKISIEEKNL